MAGFLGIGALSSGGLSSPSIELGLEISGNIFVTGTLSGTIELREILLDGDIVSSVSASGSLILYGTAWTVNADSAANWVIQ